MKSILVVVAFVFFGISAFAASETVEFSINTGISTCENGGCAVSGPNWSNVQLELKTWGDSLRGRVAAKKGPFIYWVDVWKNNIGGKTQYLVFTKIESNYNSSHQEIQMSNEFTDWSQFPNSELVDPNGLVIDAKLLIPFIDIAPKK